MVLASNLFLYSNVNSVFGSPPFGIEVFSTDASGSPAVESPAAIDAALDGTAQDLVIAGNFIFTCTTMGKIIRFDLDPATGGLSNPTELADVTTDGLQGIGVDPSQRVLCVCTDGSPQGELVVFSLDVTNGTLVETSRQPLGDEPGVLHIANPTN